MTSIDDNHPLGQVEVFVFPLTRVTLFPQTTKPLNIFEPRYVQMVHDAVQLNRRIALAYSEPGPATRELEPSGLSVQGHIRSVAGAGTVQILEKRSDSTMLVLIECEGKVHLDATIEGPEPYIRARATWIPESRGVSPANVFMMNRISKALNRWLSIHVPDPAAREGFLQRLKTPEDRVNAVCSLMVLDSDLQQTLLELNSIDERIASLAMAIESEAPFQ